MLGILASLPGAGAVGIVAAHAPSDAGLWVWVGVTGVVLAVHPALRWTSTVALVGVLVAVTLAVGVTGLPLAAAAGIGVLALVYLLALDLADVLAGADGPMGQLARGWAEAVALPAAGGLGAGALALLVAAVQISPSLPLALAGSVAVVALAVLALRVPRPRGWSVRRP